MKMRHHSLGFCIAAALSFAGTHALSGQVVPATPQKFTTRSLGDNFTGGSVGFTPVKPRTTVRTVTRIVLSPARQWKTVDGKSFVGKLIAFEDLAVEKKLETGAKPTPEAPASVPKHPTVVRDGKVRIMVDSKPVEVSLKQLGGEECNFIEHIRTEIADKE